MEASIQTVNCVLPAFILFYLFLIMTRVLFEQAPWSVPFAKGRMTGKWPSHLTSIILLRVQARMGVPGLHGGLITCWY